MKRYLAYLIAIVYMAVILVMSLIPAAGPNIVNIDKLYHFAAYAIMSSLWVVALAAKDRGRRSVIITAAVIGVFFGGFVEICQSFTATRTASFLDAVANGLGAVTGAYIFERRLLKRFAKYLPDEYMLSDNADDR